MPSIMKRFLVLLTLLVLATGVTAQGGFPREIVDDAGRKVLIPQAPGRSSLWPRATPRSSLPSGWGSGRGGNRLLQLTGGPRKGQGGRLSDPNLGGHRRLGPGSGPGDELQRRVIEDLAQLGIRGSSSPGDGGGGPHRHRAGGLCRRPRWEAGAWLRTSGSAFGRGGVHRRKERPGSFTRCGMIP